MVSACNEIGAARMPSDPDWVLVWYVSNFAAIAFHCFYYGANTLRCSVPHHWLSLKIQVCSAAVVPAAPAAERAAAQLQQHLKQQGKPTTD